MSFLFLSYLIDRYISSILSGGVTFESIYFDIASWLGPVLTDTLLLLHSLCLTFYFKPCKGWIHALFSSFFINLVVVVLLSCLCFIHPPSYYNLCPVLYLPYCPMLIHSFLYSHPHHSLPVCFDFGFSRFCFFLSWFSSSACI